MSKAAILFSVIPDLIGNLWPELSSLRNGQAMDSRFRGNDTVFVGGRGI
jgi:hypothetical protein